MPHPPAPWPDCQTLRGTQLPEHQDLARIAQDALDRLRYLCAAQWANPEDASAKAPVAQALRQHFGHRSRRVQDRLASKAQAMTKPAVAPHLFGRYGAQQAVEFLQGKAPAPAPARHIKKRLGGPQSESSRLKGQKIREIWGLNEQGLDQATQAPELPYLSFRIDKIRCVDETNPEWWGQDHIALAGLAVHAGGERTPIMPRNLGQGFDDGDEENFRPALGCHTFDLRSNPQGGAQKFLVALVLAEKDRGELHNILDAAWGEVTKDVNNTLQKELGPALSAYARPWVSGLVSSATAWVMSEFFRWMTQAFEDDIFAPAYCWMTMQHPNARFTQFGTWGSPRSDRLTAHFFGYGGHYLMDFHWTLHS